MNELTETKINQLSSILSTMTLENDLKRKVVANVRHLREIGTYIGKRHAMGMPVHGQNTLNNAKTAKKLNRRWMRKYSTTARLAPAFGIFQSPLSSKLD